MYKLALKEGLVFTALNLARLYLFEIDHMANVYLNIALEYGFEIPRNNL